MQTGTQQYVPPDGTGASASSAPATVAQPAKARTALIALAAVLTELVVIAGVGNQWVYDKLLPGNSLGMLSRGIRFSALTYTWRFTPRRGDSYHQYAGSWTIVGTTVVLSTLLIVAVVRGPITFFRAFFGAWMAVPVATMLGGYARAFVVDPPLSPGESRASRALFGTLSPGSGVFLAGFVLGLVVAIVVGFVAVLTRRPAVVATPGAADYGDRDYNDRDDGDRNDGDRGYGDRDYGDRGYGDRGYGDRGYGDRGYGDRGYGEAGAGAAAGAAAGVAGARAEPPQWQDRYYGPPPQTYGGAGERPAETPERGGETSELPSLRKDEPGSTSRLPDAGEPGPGSTGTDTDTDRDRDSTAVFPRRPDRERDTAGPSEGVSTDPERDRVGGDPTDETTQFPTSAASSARESAGESHPNEIEPNGAEPNYGARTPGEAQRSSSEQPPSDQPPSDQPPSDQPPIYHPSPEQPPTGDQSPTGHDEQSTMSFPRPPDDEDIHPER